MPKLNEIYYYFIIDKKEKKNYNKSIASLPFVYSKHEKQTTIDEKYCTHNKL